MSKGVQIVVGATLIALLLGWYVATNLETVGTFRYYQTLGEFFTEGTEGALARVHGYVAVGSIERDVAAREVRFTVQNDPPHANGHARPALAVVFHGLDTPDLFQDGAEVVVEGRLAGRGAGAVFHADNVLAKCPSKFEAQRSEAASF